MKIALLEKPELISLNKVLKYPLSIAEKDYFLALVSKIIYESALKEKIIFKGGTALHHVYLPQTRFSEDLDFSSNTQRIYLKEIQDIFKPFEFLNIKKDYESKATIKIERLKYKGPLIQENSLKIEIDFMQNVVLPAKELTYNNAYGLKTKVRVMDIKEICAEKIRAMSDRARYRDFYDFTMILKNIKIDLNEILELVACKEIRQPISHASLLNNWKIACNEKQHDIDTIYYSEFVSDNYINNILGKLKFKEITSKA